MKRSHPLIVLGTIDFFAGFVRFFLSLSMAHFFSTALTFGAVEKATARLALSTFGLLFAAFVVQIICSFLGMIHWQEPLKARTCTLWGLLSLALGLIGNLLQLHIGYGASIYAWISGVAAPALFLLAAAEYWLRVRLGKQKR